MKGKSMYIVYVGAFRFPKYDAAAARVLNNARALIACGHSVEVISWGGRYEDPAKNLGDVASYDGIDYTITGELDGNNGLWAKIKNRLFRGAKTIEILKSKKRHIDLLISYNPELSFNIKLIRFARERGIKYANDITEWSDRNEHRLLEHVADAINMKRTSHRVKNKIVISSLLNNYYKSSNNLLVPPLCNLNEDKWQSFQEVERESTSVTLIYAGNPARKDCLHIVINSVQNIIEEGNSLRLLIIGVSKDDYIDRYADLLDTETLSDHIVFMGRLPQEQIPVYYRKSDFMVLMREPTRKSMAGFPTKFVESFAAGVPVIANITSDLGTYLKDGETGFVVGDNTKEALIDVLKRILKLDPGDIQRLKLNVKEESKRFDYHYHLATFSDFITNLQ